MTTYPTLSCVRRSDTGSNAARKFRQQGLLPATVYGHGAPVSLVLDQHHFALVMHEGHSASQLVTLSIDGTESGMVLVKGVQLDAMRKKPLHVDLQRVSLQEQLQVSVPVLLEGEPIGTREGGTLELIVHALHLSCAAGLVPEHITHDISAMKIGDTLDAGALVLPQGCTLLDHPEECIALIRPPVRVEEAETTEASAPAAE